MLPSLWCAARILRATIAVYHGKDRVLDVVAAGVSLRTSAKRRLLQGEVYARRVLGKYTGAEYGDGLNARSILSLTTLGATRIPISKNSAHHGVPVYFHGSRRALVARVSRTCLNDNKTGRGKRLENSPTLTAFIASSQKRSPCPVSTQLLQASIRCIIQTQVTLCTSSPTSLRRQTLRRIVRSSASALLARQRYNST